MSLKKEVAPNAYRLRLLARSSLVAGIREFYQKEKITTKDTKEHRDLTAKIAEDSSLLLRLLCDYFARFVVRIFNEESVHRVVLGDGPFAGA
ncbi:MAG: hypothetical protein DMG68_19635, partial [Acidobacteria bacterium]